MRNDQRRDRAKTPRPRARRTVAVLAVLAPAALVAAATVGGGPNGTAGILGRKAPEYRGEVSRERPTSPARATEPRERPGRDLPDEPIEWRRSVAVGTHGAGSLRRGVALPAEGREWVSWDPIQKRRPSREWRRWGTDRLVRTTLAVMREYGRAHPNAPRVAIGDLSLPEGGFFGPQYGFIGHATHQNGLDVDVYYPRLDRRVRPPSSPGQVDVRLAQDLVDRFVAAGAETVYVGPNLPLEGPAGVVVPLANHDNHLHARLPLP